MPPADDAAAPLRGVLPVLHTPFTDDDRVDWDALAREIDWAFATGAHGVCVAMVSEVLRLTAAERLEMTRFVSRAAAGRGAAAISVGAESTRLALDFAQAAEQAGATAIMAIPPISTALPDEALGNYFAALAGGCALPLIVQDASGYVGRPIPLPLCVRLVDEFGPDKVLFKPEAPPLGPNLSALRDATGGRARIFEGSGGILLVDSFRRGIAGTMPGVDLLDGIVALWQALERQDDERAYELHAPICALVALAMQAGLDGFLAIEKHLMVRRGLFASDRRRPPYAWSLDRETAAEVDRLFERFERAIRRSNG